MRNASALWCGSQRKVVPPKFPAKIGLDHAKRGCFSLVFSAYDRIEEATVALKFYDIDPNWFYDQYRRNAFLREHEILQSLQSKDRCLQLVSALSVYDFTVPTPTADATFPCQYFAVEWIPEEIDAYFLRQEEFDAADKLYLFNEIVLAVEALHRYEIFHRDVKPDNLRAYRQNQKRIVVAIDLGTAARYDSGYVKQSYSMPVGALGYAAPEAICGLAAHRYLAPFTDHYALGCLLFELFNRGLFFHELVSRNPKYQPVLLAMGSYLQGMTTEQDQLIAWKKALARFAAGVTPVNIEGPANSAPPGIAPILNEVLQTLTHINFASRPRQLEWIRIRLWSAIRCLENERSYARNLKQRRDRRRLIEEKLKRQTERLKGILAPPPHALEQISN